MPLQSIIATDCSAKMNEIRAKYNEKYIRVYQAYSNAIADDALSRGTFSSPLFSMSRMTWIKPSFMWMMYRSGWGGKDAAQSRILAIDITHEGFQWALINSYPTQGGTSALEENHASLIKAADVLVQWDPDRDLFLRPQERRTIQLGLRRRAVELYVEEWIGKITDVTSLANNIRAHINEANITEAKSLLPVELPYKDYKSLP